MPALPEPIPSELTEPEPGDNRWANVMAEYAAGLAEYHDVLGPDEVAIDLVLAPSDYEVVGGIPASPPLARALAWRIDGPRTAEWAMAKLAEAEAQLQQLGAQADDWAARIRVWFDQAAARHLATRAFFDQHLQAYALAERDRTDGKVKTVQLPSGRVSTTASAAKAVVADEQAVVAWADATFDDPEVLQAVAPTQRRVLLNGLRELVELVEVIDRAQLTLASGEVLLWERHGAQLSEWAWSGPRVSTAQCPGVGDCWPPETGDVRDPEPGDSLVAQVLPFDSHLEVRGLDGLPVPGVAIEPAKVTAKVVPL